MTENYGLSKDELEGLDLVRFIGDYQLRTRRYTPAEIRRLLLDEGDMYAASEETRLFYLFTAEGGALTETDCEIERIGFYLNSGTSVQRIVCDLVDGKYYVDNAQPHALSAGQVERLKQLPSEYGIFEWKRHTEGEEKPSTGNFSWKLVFQLPKGEYAVYDGYTKNMTHLPPHFAEVRNALSSVIRQPQ